MDGLAELVEHYGIVAKMTSISKLQIAVGLMADWANDWQFCVSVDKCSVDVAQQ